MITVPETESDIRITIDTPYLALTGELWGVYCEDLGENWPRYNSTTLYSQVTLYSMMSAVRREDPQGGLLLYLKDGSMKTIAAQHANQRGKASGGGVKLVRFLEVKSSWSGFWRLSQAGQVSGGWVKPVRFLTVESSRSGFWKLSLVGQGSGGWVKLLRFLEVELSRSAFWRLESSCSSFLRWS